MVLFPAVFLISEEDIVLAVFFYFTPAFVDGQDIFFPFFLRFSHLEFKEILRVVILHVLEFLLIDNGLALALSFIDLFWSGGPFRGKLVQRCISSPCIRILDYSLSDKLLNLIFGYLHPRLIKLIVESLLLDNIDQFFHIKSRICVSDRIFDDESVIYFSDLIIAPNFTLPINLLNYLADALFPLVLHRDVFLAFAAATYMFKLSFVRHLRF